MRAKKKILIADDDRAILDVITIVLTDAKYDVLSETHGEKILHMVATHRPDAVLLDNWLLGANGKEIIAKMKSSNDMKHIPIILISANNDTADIARASGADDYLPKPFDIDELLAMVKKHV